MGPKRKFNLYKIKKEKYDDLIKELTEKKLEIIGESEINEHKLILFFLKKDNDGSVWWVEQYKDIFNGLDSEQYTRSNLYGVMLIYNDNYVYAISYGNAYFYLQKYCDYNFGLDLAERLVDSSGVHSKVSKYFNINKSKEMITYNNNINLEFDNGEATFYVQAKPIDTELFGNNVKFGYSASFQLDLKGDEIIKFIKNIERCLGEEAKFKVPRVKVLNEKVDKHLINDLDLELYNNLKAADRNVRFEYIGLVGTTLIVEDNIEFSISCKGQKKKKIENLNIDSISEYLLENSISFELLNNIRVTFESETFNKYSRSLNEVIDYTIEKEGKYYCLVNGKWSEFNESYIEYLRENLDKISDEILYDKDYDFKVDQIEKIRASCTDTLNYNEYLYNKYYMKKFGFECYDRDFIPYGNVNVELADLYKNNTLYHVKIGENGKLIYAIDQSTLSIKVLKDPNKKTEVNKKLGNKEIKNIGLILIFDSQSLIKKGIINLNNINSLIFKMKIMEWYNCIKLNNYRPELLVNFKK